VKFLIRPVAGADKAAMIQVSLSAFEPIFRSFESILGPDIYPMIYPDWVKRQTDTVESVLGNEKIHVWVAETDGNLVGYIAYEFFEADKSGEVQLIAVHPDYQNAGLGTELNNFALQHMSEAGMRYAVVSTGGDEAHAPARRSYEKSGYTPLPLVRYYKKL
jgi:ribosomal protein S18 acetylase RimI-like enzyme